MNILITNHGLRHYGGSELFVFEIAGALVNRGHRVAAFTTVTGEISERLEQLGVPVVSEPDRCPFTPDIIHGQHHLEAMAAITLLPGVPAIYQVHGSGPWEEQPPRHPRIVRYLGNAPMMAWWIAQQTGVEEASIGSVINFFDPERFRTTRSPTAEPKRALVYHNAMDPESGAFREISTACSAVGLSVEAIGTASGNTVSDPENHLPDYDIVFAAGRSAIEAMACGCAVIPITVDKMAALITPETWEHAVARNFCADESRPLIEAAGVETQLRAVSAEDAAEVTRRVRRDFTLEAAADSLIEVYEKAIASHRAGGPPEVAAEAAATGRYLLSLASQVKATDQNRIDLAHLARQAEDRAERCLRAAEEAGKRTERQKLRGNRWKAETHEWKQRARSGDRHIEWLHATLASGPWWQRRLGRRLRREWQAQQR